MKEDRINFLFGVGTDHNLKLDELGNAGRANAEREALELDLSEYFSGENLDNMIKAVVEDR